MNAEQLRGVLERLASAHATLKTSQTLEELRASLEEIANNPGNAEIQARYRERLTRLSIALEANLLNVFSLRENSIIHDAGLDELKGEVLYDAVREALSGQDMTPSVARDNIAAILSRFSSRLNKTRLAAAELKDLNVGLGEPPPLSVELGMFIPHGSENLRLDAILSEGEELNRLIAAAHEAIDGGFESPEVLYLTSSDYGFLLQINPATAALLIVSIERTLAFYKTSLETIKLQRELAKQGDQIRPGFEPLIEQMTKLLRDGYEADVRILIRKEVGDRSKLASEEEKNAAAAKLTKFVRQFVEQSEHGTYFDVRTNEGDAPDEANLSDEANEIRAQIDRIREVRLLAQSLHKLEQEERPRIAAPPTGKDDLQL